MASFAQVPEFLTSLKSILFKIAGAFSTPSKTLWGTSWEYDVKENSDSINDIM